MSVCMNYKNVAVWKKLIFQKELILKNLKNQKNVWSAITSFFKNKNFNFEKLVLNGYRDISMMCYELKSIATFKIKVVAGVFYGIWLLIKLLIF